MIQESLFADPPKQSAPDKHRTKSGSLRASTLKAIEWYAIHHGLKAKGAGAYPTFYFSTRDGGEVALPVAVIVDAYKEFRRTTYGRAAKAA